MAQITWRVPDELANRVRQAAGRQGRSVNEYLTRVLDASTDPDLAGTEASRVRERLARAGLLAPAGAPRRESDPDELARARERAGKGTDLSALVGQDRG